LPKSTFKRFRSAVLWLTWLGFASRLIVPAGYMPAAPGEGGYIRLCPAGPAGALVNAVSPERTAHHHESGQHHGESPNHDHGGGQGYDTEYCPAGAFFSAAVAVPAFDSQLRQLSFARPVHGNAAFAALLRPVSGQPRAPPVVQSA
jgi:hypothetical protein